jgi:serine/threonine protein kinase
MNLEAQQRLFDACLDLDDAQREALLAACPDPELRDAVRNLLRAHAESADSLPSVFSADEFPRLAAPHQVGPYRILERLGEGGMGDVFLAQQQEPVRRRVAIKILKFGLATREVLARFELERQTLAVLTHTNIARIFDAGTTDDGRPYFAMEYVPGVPITRYCDEHELSIEARLALFAQVCAGVQHAHLRGIIHRDLKPSNILVCEIDGAPMPKIIDFGIAKATTAAADADTYTRIGNLLGTPEYMSPEQVQLSPLDIDARTDVYSLGVVLYQLLTGARPYSITSDSLSPAVLLEQISTRDARRPSDVAKGPTPESIERAQARGLTPSSLASRLRGDLDWIVLKAIEKDRQRRYESAAALVADLDRHSQDEAVLAGPPSSWYRFGKFARRHRLAVGVASSVFAAALVFGSAMAWFATEAREERDRANQEAEIARSVTAFTAGLFELANPATTGTKDTSARELLDMGVKRLSAQSDVQHPEVRTALLEAAGNAYRGIGEYAKAETLLRDALAYRATQQATAPTTHAQTLLNLALVKRDRGEFEEAAKLARQAVAAMHSAERLPSETTQLANLQLAEILRRNASYEEAAALARSTLSAPSTQSVRAQALYALGRIHASQGQLEDAERLLRESHELFTRFAGRLDERTIDAKNGLADTLVTLGRPHEAEPLLREIVADVRQIYGERHGIVGIALNNLANATSDIPEKYAEATQTYEAAAALLAETLGANHIEVATTYNNLGVLFTKTQEWERAESMFRQAMAIRETALGSDHPEFASAVHGRAIALMRLGRFQEAEPLLRRSLNIFTRALGEDHWRVANARFHFGLALANLQQFKAGYAEMDQGYQGLVATFGQEHPRVIAARKSFDEAPKEKKVLAAQ